VVVGGGESERDTGRTKVQEGEDPGLFRRYVYSWFSWHSLVPGLWRENGRVICCTLFLW